MTQAQTTTQSTIAVYDSIHRALAVRGAIVALYRTGDVTEKARVIVPERLYTTDAGADILRGWDSVRGTTISYRVDRFASMHLLPVQGVSR
jgi:predicted DNA-binding transcriptional regulator YafY